MLHGGPFPGVALEALEDELGHLGHGLRGVLVVEPRVDNLPELPLLRQGWLGPFHQIVLATGPIRVQGL